MTNFVTYTGKQPKLPNKEAKSLWKKVSTLRPAKGGEKVLIKNLDPKLKKLYSKVWFWRYYVLAITTDLSRGVEGGQDEKISFAQAVELMRAKYHYKLATLEFWCAVKERYSLWCVDPKAMSVRSGWKLVG